MSAGARCIGMHHRRDSPSEVAFFGPSTRGGVAGQGPPSQQTSSGAINEAHCALHRKTVRRSADHARRCLELFHCSHSTIDLTLIDIARVVHAFSYETSSL